MANELQSIINAIKKPVLDLIKSNTSTVVRRESAVVISVNNATKTAVVRLGTSPARDDQNMTLPNMTGDVLAAGDTVWVDMWGSPAFNAVISMKNAFDESIR